VPSAERNALLEIPGMVPALTDLKSGCAFAPRCNKTLPNCNTHKPELIASEQGHLTACWAVNNGNGSKV
jgi:peptide/nickel transport system ATP-binding protein